jgi:hypothetical protein
MIERVAEAISDREAQFYPGHFDAKELARAAIEAMRKPTSEMTRAFYGPIWADNEAEDCWDRMIDEALKQ